MRRSLIGAQVAVRLDGDRSLVGFYARHGFRPVPGGGDTVRMGRRRRR